MPRIAGPLPLLATVVLLALGCDAVLSGFAPDRLRIRELAPSQVEGLVRDGRGEIVQLRDPHEGLPGIPGARRLTVDAPLSESAGPADGWLIVVARDRAQGLRLAARLARAGASRVAFTVGEKSDLIALSGVRTAAQAAGRHPAKPTPPSRHPNP